MLLFVDSAADAEELRGHLVCLGQRHHRRRRVGHVRHGHARALGCPKAGQELELLVRLWRNLFVNKCSIHKLINLDFTY